MLALFPAIQWDHPGFTAGKIAQLDWSGNMGKGREGKGPRSMLVMRRDGQMTEVRRMELCLLLSRWWRAACGRNERRPFVPLAPKSEVDVEVG
jgi:hypothetical protein